MIDKRKMSIVKPMISEKNTDLEDMNKYVFQIIESANASWVKQDVEKLWKVEVESINIARLPGKKKRVKRTFKTTTPIKKAIVTLKEGYKIDILEK
ncbi:MAG: 50S ribosomal protein L23 [Caldisericia bacterium]|jgi:large subunit ribosomal protein L23|nr:50S ribosomal protein L23 [Caldisericia bacterium]